MQEYVEPEDVFDVNPKSAEAVNPTEKANDMTDVDIDVLTEDPVCILNPCNGQDRLAISEAIMQLAQIFPLHSASVEVLYAISKELMSKINLTMLPTSLVPKASSSLAWIHMLWY